MRCLSGDSSAHVYPTMIQLLKDDVYLGGNFVRIYISQQDVCKTRTCTQGGRGSCKHGKVEGEGGGGL